MRNSLGVLGFLFLSSSIVQVTPERLFSSPNLPQPNGQAPSPPKFEGHTSPNPWQCKKCQPALSKAMDYVAKNYSGGSFPGPIYAGFMYLMEPGMPHAQEFNRCVSYACRNITAGGFNGNWYIGYCMYFLAEVYLRTGNPEALAALNRGLKAAAEQQEPETGGWGHHKEYWKESGYNKHGGGKDLGSVTTMIYAAFVMLKSAGVDVPASMMDRARKNLDSISDGAGFCYGTDNKFHDICMSRGANVLLGLSSAGQTGDPWFNRIAQAIDKRYTAMEKGHAFGPLHMFAVGAAMHRLGTYQKFAEQWIDKLIERQTSEGVVVMYHDGGQNKFPNDLASTAVFACLLMLQKPDVFPPPKRAGNASAKAGKPRDPNAPSPFARPKPKEVAKGPQNPEATEPYAPGLPPEPIDEVPPPPMTGGGIQE